MMRSSSATRSSREVCEYVSNAGFYGCIDILGRAEQDLADRLFGRRIDDVELAASSGAHPRTVDEKLPEVVHEGILRGGGA
jgi:hypothetical protein